MVVTDGLMGTFPALPRRAPASYLPSRLPAPAPAPSSALPRAPLPRPRSRPPHPALSVPPTETARKYPRPSRERISVSSERMSGEHVVRDCNCGGSSRPLAAWDCSRLTTQSEEQQVKTLLLKNFRPPHEKSQQLRCPHAQALPDNSSLSK